MLRKRCYYTPKNASYFVTRNLGSHFSAKTQNFVPLKILPRLSPDFCLSPKKGWRPARTLRVSDARYTGKMDFFWEGEQDMEALFEHMQRLQRRMEEEDEVAGNGEDGSRKRTNKFWAGGFHKTPRGGDPQATGKDKWRHPSHECEWWDILQQDEMFEDGFLSRQVHSESVLV